MKSIVLNKCFGTFILSDEAARELGVDKFYYSKECFRTAKELVDLVNNKGTEWCSCCLSKLQVVEIPDETTDWQIVNYDGVESLYFVVGGKIYVK